MACHRTKPAWKTRRPNKNGKFPILLRAPEPYRDPDYYIPCNRCLGCKADQSREWAIRIEHEARMSELKCFLTLTYSDEYCPKKIDRKLLTIKMKELQRKLDCNLRYFAVGEYGDKTKRPHYHAVLFNTDLLGGAEQSRPGRYLHPAITGLWPYGQHEIQPYDEGTACYTAGYISKKLGDEDTFSIKSTRPPLGKTFALEYPGRLLSQGTTIVNGNELPIPKVYLQWLEQAGHNVEPTKEKIRAISREKHPITDKEGRSKDINAQAKINRKGERI